MALAKKDCEPGHTRADIDYEMAHGTGRVTLPLRKPWANIANEKSCLAGNPFATLQLQKIDPTRGMSVRAVRLPFSTASVRFDQDAAIWVLLQQIVVRGFVAVKFLAIGRILGPAAIGSVSVALLAVAIAEALSDTGLAQAVAILPGISRSGSTVSAALWRNLGPAAAAEFSFLLAVPVIAGAALLEGRHATASLAAIGVIPFVMAFVVAFASGIWAIRFLVALLKRGRFYAFAPYCWAVGALTLALALWRR